jgi:predicted small secreted protein
MKDRFFAFVANYSTTLGFVAVIVVVLMMLTGGNTIAGMGADIQKSANWTAEKMSGSKSEPPKSN